MTTSNISAGTSMGTVSASNVLSGKTFYNTSGSTGTAGSGSYIVAGTISTDNINLRNNSLTDTLNNLYNQQQILIEYLKYKGFYNEEEFKDFVEAFKLANKLDEKSDVNGLY